MHTKGLYNLITEQKNRKKIYYDKELRIESTKYFRQFCELHNQRKTYSYLQTGFFKKLYLGNLATMKIGDKFTTNTKNTGQALLCHFYSYPYLDNKPKHLLLSLKYCERPNNSDDSPFSEDQKL